MSVISDEDIKIAVSRALGTSVKIIDYKFEAFSKEITGFIGVHRVLTVQTLDQTQCNDADTKIHTFFVKTFPESSTTTSVEEEGLMKDLFNEEISFYNELIPRLIKNFNIERWSPRCYLAKSDLLIFEDLRAQGFVLCKDSFLDEKYLRAGLSALARFHASSILAEKQMGKTFKEAYPNLLHEKLYTNDKDNDKFIRIGYKTIAALAELFGLDSSLVPKIYDKVYKDVRPRDDSLNVVCHGDLWKNNILFDSNDPPNCLLVDFQVTKYTSPVIDVSMFLCLHTTPDFRKKIELDLFKHYYAILNNILVVNHSKTQVPSYEDIFKNYLDSKLSGMAYAAIYLPFIYMKPAAVQEIMNDPVKKDEWINRNRIGFIESYMKTDDDYAKKIKDIITVLIKEADKVLDK